MPQAKSLSESDIKRVLSIITVGRNAARNRIAFLLSWQAGMRVGEIAALRMGDVFDERGAPLREIWLNKDQTKGKEGRVVYVNDRMARELTVYFSGLKQVQKEKPLIPSSRGAKHFSSTTLCMLFSSIYKAAGINTSSHSGRRTFATNLNALGIGMRTIQRLMGHKHIETTAIYCDVSEPLMRRAVNLLQKLI